MSKRIRPIRRWEIPNGKEKPYVVTEWHDSVWKCSCPHWIFRLQRTGEDCKHIIDVKDGRYESSEEPREYDICPGNVGKVTVNTDTPQFLRVLVPLIPLGSHQGGWLAYTCMYDCLRLGIPWKNVMEYYSRVLRSKPTKALVTEYIEEHGRLEYTQWVRGLGWIGLKTIPVEKKCQLIGR